MLFIFGAVALNLYAVILILARAFVYRTKLYRPMLWNVLLSVAPIVVLLIGFMLFAVLVAVVGPAAWGVAVLFGFVWLLILPNSSYLITELNFSHRRDDDGVPLWYDIILVISLAMSGVVNTVANIFLVHLLAATTVYGDTAEALVRPGSWIAVGCVMLLLGLGMYLGRYLRVNSWDVRHPVGLMRKVVTHFRTPGNFWACVGFSLTYAVFLAIIYVIVVGSKLEGLISLEALRLQPS